MCEVEPDSNHEYPRGSPRREAGDEGLETPTSWWLVGQQILVYDDVSFRGRRPALGRVSTFNVKVRPAPRIEWSGQSAKLCR